MNGSIGSFVKNEVGMQVSSSVQGRGLPVSAAIPKANHISRYVVLFINNGTTVCHDLLHHHEKLSPISLCSSGAICGCGSSAIISSSMCSVACTGAKVLLLSSPLPLLSSTSIDFCSVEDARAISRLLLLGSFIKGACSLPPCSKPSAVNF